MLIFSYYTSDSIVWNIIGLNTLFMEKLDPLWKQLLHIKNMKGILNKQHSNV